MKASVIGPAVLLAVLLAGSHALLRYSAGLATSILSWPRSGYVVAAMTIYVAVFAYYSVLLERLPLSRLYPVYTGLSVAFVYVAGVLLFKEAVTVRGGVGIVLLVLGVFLAADR